MDEAGVPTISFGTSGLRGPASGFSNERIAAYTTAFLDIAVADSGNKSVFVGADLRDSSPRITASCISAIRSRGWKAIYGGNVPTPALALAAISQNCPAIMVTGSHLPGNHNGIKFYRRQGELLKSDEEPIREVADLSLRTPSAEFLPPPLPIIDPSIARAYVQRYTSVFPPNSLEGLRVGVELHSAVGRDLLVEVLQVLGAACFPFRRSKKFVAMDTEALGEDDIARAQEQIQQNELHCVVTTDGDGDRPLLIDESCNQINGDVLGALTAKILGIESVVTPLSSTSAIEKSGWFNQTIRTKIGSPYVVAAMARETKSGNLVAGFEANGGFLLGCEITLTGGTLSPLLTRDAMLPLITILDAASTLSLPLSDLADSLPKRFMKAGRIKNIPDSKAHWFLNKVETSNSYRSRVSALLSDPLEISTLDGVRMTMENSSIVHLRQSGNAPEMRIYVETDTHQSTDQILNDVSRCVSLQLNSGTKS